MHTSRLSKHHTVTYLILVQLLYNIVSTPFLQQQVRQRSEVLHASRPSLRFSTQALPEIMKI